MAFLTQDAFVALVGNAYRLGQGCSYICGVQTATLLDDIYEASIANSCHRRELTRQSKPERQPISNLETLNISTRNKLTDHHRVRGGRTQGRGLTRIETSELRGTRRPSPSLAAEPSKYNIILPAKLFTVQLHGRPIANDQLRRRIPNDTHQPVWPASCNQDALVPRRGLDRLADERCRVWPA